MNVKSTRLESTSGPDNNVLTSRLVVITAASIILNTDSISMYSIIVAVLIGLTVLTRSIQYEIEDVLR